MQGGGILPPEGKQGLAPAAAAPRGSCLLLAPAWQPSSVGPSPRCPPMALGFTGSWESPSKYPPARALGAGERGNTVPQPRATPFGTGMAMPAPPSARVG